MRAITTEDINNILGISESYQLHGALMDILFNKEKRTQTFKKFLDLESDLSYDWFLDYFQEEQAARKSLKQDYTPVCLCDLLSELSDNNGIVWDCCAGIGGLTIANWNKNKNRIFICEELSDNSVAVLLFNLSIRNVQGYVRHCDVLSGELKNVYKLTPGESFSDIEVSSLDIDKAHTVISNPPYSLKFDNVEKYENDERFKLYGLPPKSKADYAFVLHGLHKLESNGTALYILPHGVLFRGQKEGEIRKRLIENNVIDAVIGLPEGLFSNTSIPVCIIVLKRERKCNDVLFIDASREFEKKGKQNYLSCEQITKIADTYVNRRNIDRYSQKVNLKEIEENDYNLNIPRYVDTSEPPEEIDLRALIDEMEEIDRDIEKTTREIANTLNDLNGNKEYETEKQRFINFSENKEYYLYSYISQMCAEFVESDFIKCAGKKNVSLYDVADFERSKKNKIYSKGSILIQLSATKGQMKYMTCEGTVDAKYGVIQSKINSKYLYYVLDMVMCEFLRKYQTGLNINPEIFKYLYFDIHTDEQVQNSVVKMLDFLEEGITSAEKEKEQSRSFKQYHLNGMFPKI